MGIESIVLELMERIKVLEGKVSRLEAKMDGERLPQEEGESLSLESALKNEKETRKVSLTQSARDYINKVKREAREEGKDSVTLLCNDIQKALGVTNRAFNVCQAMYACMDHPSDKVLSAPPSGFSTTVLVQYFLND